MTILVPFESALKTLSDGTKIITIRYILICMTRNLKNIFCNMQNVWQMTICKLQKKKKQYTKLGSFWSFGLKQENIVLLVFPGVRNIYFIGKSFICTFLTFIYMYFSNVSYVVSFITFISYVLFVLLFFRH